MQKSKSNKPLKKSESSLLLTKFRELAGLTQGDLGKLMSYDRRYIWKRENGSVEVSMDFAKEVSPT